MLQLVRNEIKRYLTKKGYAIRKLDGLTLLANSYGSDKGTRYTAHMYTRVYRKIFEARRNDRLNFLEIGLHRTEADRRRPNPGAEGTTPGTSASSAPSLAMWREYFPHARLFGFDIDDFSQVAIDGCSILRGDMSSRSDLESLARAIGEPIDIVIEDGSHVSHHQQIAFGALFPYLRSGGLYCIEDLHWQDPALEKHDAPKTRDLLEMHNVLGKFESPFLTEDERKFIEGHVERVRLYDSLTCQLCSDPALLPDNGDGADAIAIIQKK